MKGLRASRMRPGPLLSVMSGSLGLRSSSSFKAGAPIARNGRSVLHEGSRRPPGAVGSLRQLVLDVDEGNVKRHEGERINRL
jgi:hypothetical protein